MLVKIWELPINAEWHRATELKSLSFDRDGLTLLLIEDGTEVHWSLHFPEVQAYKCITEESASGLLELLPERGAFYEVGDSPWLRELGQGRLEYMSQSKHYVVCCYDEVLEIAATRYAVERC